MGWMRPAGKGGGILGIRGAGAGFWDELGVGWERELRTRYLRD